MKNLNVPIEDERHEDLIFIQKYYTEKTGIKLSKAQTLKKLLFETANLIRNTGEIYPNRDWTFENQEEKKGESNAK
jgi:hypothetical protein